jgi:hypothetical protein
VHSHTVHGGDGGGGGGVDHDISLKQCQQNYTEAIE